jgi:membrane protein YqaA with SNARE-associated domain
MLDATAQYLFQISVRLGGFGLLAMGVLDSSFLFMPLGNDLLVVAMTARQRELMLYFAAMATAGSVLGCLLIDVVSRKGGEKGLERFLPARRIESVKRRVSEHAGWALAFASLMPPPFPFTPFVAGAAALQYPRKNLLAIVAATRFFRFGLEGFLALHFGTGILRLAAVPAVQYSVLALVVISIGGSIFSVYRWIQRSHIHVTR